ncbi:MAG: di-heme oxidoredictase family protein [Gammaproteobacteria bacterium]
MSAARRMDFTLGQALFKRLWVTAPSTTQAADGLGPLYNARSCSSCHQRNGRGKPQDTNGNTHRALILRLSIPTSAPISASTPSALPDPLYGAQLQTAAIPGLSAEAQVHITYHQHVITMADNETVTLRTPHYEIQHLSQGPLHPNTHVSPRLAPALLGLGLLEAIPRSALDALADPNDRDGDGISGRLNVVWSRVLQQEMPGRFGWKASAPSVNEQTQNAFFNDIGISVPLLPDGAGDCTAYQHTCQNAPTGNSPQYDDLEAHSMIVNLTTLYVSNLAVPKQRNPQDPSVLRAACHHPSFSTTASALTTSTTSTTKTSHTSATHVSSNRIWPYTDLLLHDMGEGLADQHPKAHISDREWRTAPLWGIGLNAAVNGNQYYLHDGRARSLLEAILWHGGEAQTARDTVITLTRSQRIDLIQFIHSL